MLLFAGCSSKSPTTAGAAACDGGVPCASGGGGGETTGSGGSNGASGGAEAASGGANTDGTDASKAGSSGGIASCDACDGGAEDGAAPVSACVPAMPKVPWTSPYAAWSRGIPTDPAFFPIATWLQGSWHADELHTLGVNIYVGNNAGTDAMAATDLAIIKKLGMYAIVGQDSVGLKNLDDPTIVGWWMDPDEPDNAQPAQGGGYGPPVAPATLVARYNAFKTADPTRPIYLGLGQGVAYDGWEGRGSNAPPESGYVPASDIISFDIYPYNNCGGDANEKATCGQFWLNALGIDRLHGWSNRSQATWTDIETTVIAKDTKTGPTPAQTVSEVWLSLIHGATGVEYFLDTWEPTFQEDGIFKDAAMVTAVTKLDQQILDLAPELNSATFPNLVTVKGSNASAPLDTMVKGHGTSLYVFSAVSRAGATTGTFTINGMTGSGTAKVVGENRSVALNHGTFVDDFAANGVHIYQIDFSLMTCANTG